MGSVLSPLLFSVYLDDLLKQLRNLQLGCHIGGYWFGGCGYADDLILLAPNIEVLQSMLQLCQQYAGKIIWSFLLTQCHQNQKPSVSISVADQAMLGTLTLYSLMGRIYHGWRVLTILVTLFIR